MRRARRTAMRFHRPMRSCGGARGVTRDCRETCTVLCAVHRGRSPRGRQRHAVTRDPAARCPLPLPAPGQRSAVWLAWCTGVSVRAPRVGRPSRPTATRDVSVGSGTVRSVAWRGGRSWSGGAVRQLGRPTVGRRSLRKRIFSTDRGSTTATRTLYPDSERSGSV